MAHRKLTNLIQHSQTLFYLWYTQIRDVHQLLAGFLNGLNGRLVGCQFRFESLVLLLQILHSSQVTTVIVRSYEQFLLLDPRLLIGNVTEELMQRHGLVQACLAMRRQILDTFVALVDGLAFLLQVIVTFNHRIRFAGSASNIKIPEWQQRQIVHSRSTNQLGRSYP